MLVHFVYICSFRSVYLYEIFFVNGFLFVSSFFDFDHHIRLLQRNLWIVVCACFISSLLRVFGFWIYWVSCAIATIRPCDLLVMRKKRKQVLVMVKIVIIFRPSLALSRFRSLINSNVNNETTLNQVFQHTHTHK